MEFNYADAEKMLQSVGKMNDVEEGSIGAKMAKIYQRMAEVREEEKSLGDDKIAIEEGEQNFKE